MFIWGGWGAGVVKGGRGNSERYLKWGHAQPKLLKRGIKAKIVRKLTGRGS